MITNRKASGARARRARRGQILVLFAVVVITLIVVCSLTVDVGRMVTSQAQLRNAVDAAALAGASQLVGFTTEAEKAAARQEAVSLALANSVAGKPLTLAEDDVCFGHYDETARQFIPESNLPPGAPLDSIWVRGRRSSDSPDGPIDLFFASIFGIHAHASSVSAVGTQPRRYVMFVMDRSGSMCFDTENILYRYSGNQDGSFDHSPSGWYWLPSYIYKGGWQTAWFYAVNDDTGETVTDFLPPHVKDNMLYGTYFRYCEKDDPSYVESGWLYVPEGVTLYSAYGPGYTSWYAQSYGPIGSCDYAMAGTSVEPLNSSQNAAIAFVDLLNAEREKAGLVSYATRATLDHILTSDWDSLKDSIRSYDPRGATATGDAMRLANDELIDSGRADAYGHRVMILLTDGMANCVNGHYYGNPDSPITVHFFGEDVQCRIYQAVVDEIQTQTRRAMTNGVRIYTVSFGEDADQALMPLIARKTGGAYYYAPEHENLVDIFVDIFYRLPPVLTR